MMLSESWPRKSARRLLKAGLLDGVSDFLVMMAESCLLQSGLQA
jgi:hypothetical protein